MYKVIREIHFSYGHRLLNHPDKCRHLHGHNGRVQVEISSAGLDGHNMVVDFDQIRQKIGDWVKRELDHKTILWEKDPLVPVLKQAGEPVVAMPEHPTAEVLARLIFVQARAGGLAVSKVTLWETIHSCAVYHE